MLILNKLRKYIFVHKLSLTDYSRRKEYHINKIPSLFHKTNYLYINHYVDEDYTLINITYYLNNKINCEIDGTSDGNRTTIIFYKSGDMRTIKHNITMYKDKDCHINIEVIKYKYTGIDRTYQLT